jgi:hypothetical protein
MSFIDNNILLDEIVMLKPDINVVGDIADRSGFNVFAEIDHAAIPFLKSISIDSRTKIRVLSLGDGLHTFLDNERLRIQYSDTTLGINGASKVALFVTDKEWLDLYRKKQRVGHISGYEKGIHLDQVDGNWYAYFKDAWAGGGYSFSPLFTTDDSEFIETYQHHEPFYWSPDMPLLAVKQAQVLKNALTHNSIVQQEYNRRSSGYSKYHECVNALIYDSRVNSIRRFFFTQKPNFNIFINKDTRSWSNRVLSQYQSDQYDDFVAATVAYPNYNKDTNYRYAQVLGDRHVSYKFFNSQPYAI